MKLSFLLSLIFVLHTYVGNAQGVTALKSHATSRPQKLTKQESKDSSGTSIAASKDATFTFGTSYLRIYAEFLYIPQRSGRKNSIYFDVKTLNKVPLEFKAAFEPKPTEHYSDTGQFLIVPYIALNTKIPIEITIEKRTRTDTSGFFGILNGVLGTAANIFTGGALGTVTTLTKYVTAGQTAVQNYEKSTESSDFNRTIKFDAAEFNNFQDGVVDEFAIFTNGKETINGTLDCPNGEKQALKESSICDVLPANSLNEASTPTHYKFNIGTLQCPRMFYPDGKSAFVVIRIQVYKPFLNLDKYPEGVADISKHFVAMRDAINKNLDAIDKNELPITLKNEGTSLYSTLQTLTATGDLSLSDAKIIMNAYIRFFPTAPSGDTATTAKYKSVKDYLMQICNQLPDIDDDLRPVPDKVPPAK